MLNIFIELWKAQQENGVTIPELFFPDTFILDENHDFIWLFRSQQEGKILRKKKINSSISSIIHSIASYNCSNDDYSQQLQQRWQISETPVVTYSRLNDSGQIEIEHLTMQETTRFFEQTEYRSALPRDSIFLQRYIRTDSNEIHGHFIKVIYNQNFISIERRHNCYFWQHSAEGGSRPRDKELYDCFLSFEAPEQFTQIDKLNTYTATQLKYITKQICIQLEYTHEKERGKVKQISLIFKKVQEVIYLLHCNEITFEKEQHIPKLWRMSYALPFVVPSRRKHFQKSSASLLANGQEQISQMDIQKSQEYQQPSDLASGFLSSKFTVDSEQEVKTNKNSTFLRQFKPALIEQVVMCNACGQREDEDQMQEVTKNKILRIRIKRGIREQFNGLLPLYASKDKNDKAIADKYSFISVCRLCFAAFQEISLEDENNNNNLAAQVVKSNNSKQTRSRSFNLPHSVDCSFSTIPQGQTPNYQKNNGFFRLTTGQVKTPDISVIHSVNSSCFTPSASGSVGQSSQRNKIGQGESKFLLNKDLRYKFKELRSKSNSRGETATTTARTRTRTSSREAIYQRNETDDSSSCNKTSLSARAIIPTKNLSLDSRENQYSSSFTEDQVFLKKFYQQQLVEKERKEGSQLLEINTYSHNNSIRQDYISINHLTTNQCLRSQDILERMRSINTPLSGQRRNYNEVNHAQVMSDFNKIYEDQKYQVQLLKQKNQLFNQHSEILDHSGDTLNVSKNNNFLNIPSARSNKDGGRVGGEYNLLENIKHLEVNNPLYELDSNRENNQSVCNVSAITSAKSTHRGFNLPPKPTISTEKRGLKQSFGGSGHSILNDLNGNKGKRQRNSLQMEQLQEGTMRRKGSVERADTSSVHTFRRKSLKIL